MTRNVSLRAVCTAPTPATDVCRRLFGEFGHTVIDLPPDAGPANLDGADIGETDILLSGILDPALTPFGSGYSELLGHNPRMVVTSVTPFGLTGSLAGRRGDSLLAEAYGGLATMIGEPGERPLALGGEQAVFAAGTAAFLGSCLALLNRDRTGLGDLVDVAMSDVAAYMEWKSDVVLQTEGTAPVRSGTSGSWQLVPCSDGNVGIIYQAGQWETLCDLVDEAGEGPLRGAGDGTPEAARVIRGWAAERTGEEIYHSAQALGLPFGYCMAIGDLVQSPQYQSRRFIRTATGQASRGQVVRLPLLSAAGASAGLVRAAEHRGAGASMAPAPGVVGDAGHGLDSTQALPLHGMMVLDLGTITAGAAVSRILADYGATVLKVESPSAPDSFRFWNAPEGAAAAGNDRALASPYFENNNVNKLGLALDLKTSRGRTVFADLARHADVIVENFSVGVTRRLGIDYDELRKINPRLLYLSLSSQGQTGPESTYRSYGSTVDLLSGLASVTGYGPGRPLWSSRDVNYPDQLAALFGAAVIVHGRYAASAGHLDVAQREVVSWTLARDIARTLATGTSPAPSGNNRGGPWTRDTFPTCDDQWIAISCLTSEDQDALTALIATNDQPAPGKDRDRYEDVAAWTRSRTADDSLGHLARADIPAVRAHDAESRAADPRFHQRQLFQIVPAGHNKGLRVKGAPFVMSRVTPGIRRQAPAIGQDTDTIIQWLKAR